MFRSIPHNLSDADLGLLVFVLLPLLGGGCWLYNAWRMGRLPWKPKGPPNARLVSLVIVLGIVLAVILSALVD